jgi:thioredoxin 1
MRNTTKSLTLDITTPYLVNTIYLQLKSRKGQIMAAQSVTDESFAEEVLQAEGPVMVDFWAEWCGPCKALAPLVDELSEEVGDKLKIVKVNIDDSPNSPSKYSVRGIPTLMIFRNGEVVDTRVGGLSKSQLSEWVDSVVA